jgi:hypothetical protein
MSFGLQILTCDSRRPMRSLIGEHRYHLEISLGEAIIPFGKSLVVRGRSIPWQ